MIRRLTSGPKPFVAGAIVELAQRRGAARAIAVAHAVVARQVRARLGHRDQVVDRDRLRAVRQLDVHQLRARLAQQLEAAVAGGEDLGIEAVAEQAAGDADAQPADVTGQRRRVVFDRRGGRGGVARIVAADRPTGSAAASATVVASGPI